MNKFFDLIIIGAGASGVFAAINFKHIYPHKKVLIIEKNNKALSKVKISGGGRCNVTHDCKSVSELIKNYPRGGKKLSKIFNQFGVNDTFNWFENRGVKLKIEADGRVFPQSNDSQSIIDCFFNEINKYQIEILFSADFVDFEKENDTFKVFLKNDRSFESQFLHLAMGGFNKIDSFDFLIKKGFNVATPIPSLFTFNLKKKDGITELMGISKEKVGIRVLGTKETIEGSLLITHWGFSGPAVLKLSSLHANLLFDKQYDYQISINWLFPNNLEQIKTAVFPLESTKKVFNQPLDLISKRLWQYFLTKAEIETEDRWNNLSKKKINKLAEILSNDMYEMKGKTTYKEEFVTSGGVDLSEINLQTFESTKIPNLFFSGELLNIDAFTGGFNFQAAWSGAFAVAKGIGEKVS
jgi:predicted Rossmann fold flavoprotein